MRTSRLMLRAFLGPFAVTLPVALFILDMQFLWVYADDMMPSTSQWNRDSARPHPKLKDARAFAEAIGQREVMPDVVMTLLKDRHVPAWVPVQAILHAGSIPKDAVPRLLISR